MVGLRYVATLSGDAAPFSLGITDLEIATIGDGVQLYATNRSDGGLSAFDISSVEAPVLLSQQDFRSGVTHLATPQISILHSDGGPFILPVGMTQSYAAAYMLGDSGEIGAQMRFASQTPPPTDLIALTEVTTGPHTYIVAARSGMAVPSVYEIGADQQLNLVSVAQGQTSGSDLTGLTGITLGGGHYVLGVSPVGNRITSYRVGNDGQISEVATLDSLTSGLGFDTPHVVSAVAVGGVGYAVLGSAGSSSLTVLRIGADGRMQPVEHVVDNLHTRFQGVSALETFTLEDRVFVLAGGADDGVSVMSLLPDGRLIHLSTLADTDATTLQNVTAIAAGWAGGQAQVFVTSETEAGISRFALDLGDIGLTRQGGSGPVAGTAQADVLMAGADTTALNGGAGGDILVAAGQAGGALQMSGGAGQDIFVAAHNGQVLTIMDYQPGLDQLDLSLFPMLRSMQQLQIESTGRGARLEFGDTVIEVVTQAGRPLDAAHFTDANGLALTRYSPPSEPDQLTGTDAGNLLELGAGGGSAFGLGGDDTITSSWGDAYIGGGAGNDLIVGGAGNNLIYTGTGSDTVQGGTGADKIHGAGGPNRLFGNDGNDWISGGAAGDGIAGGAGNDSLYGGAGNDAIYLGLGDDIAGGGAGNDLIVGGAGSNLIYTGTGSDTVQGGTGADKIHGAGGPNRLFGNDGNDWISGGAAGDGIAGGAGNDSLYGGAGNDAIYLGLGDDIAGGGAGNDLIVGGAGNNLIYTGTGSDTVQGGTGADKIHGAGGPNRLFGNDGNDWISGGAAGDGIAGGAGNDSLYGGAGNDAIYLGLGDDVAGGGAGNDLIVGGAGSNLIYGGAGDDTVHAGAGRDVITGGPGADVFVFASAAQAGVGAGRDVITDFTAGIDKIDLSALNLTFVGTAEFSGTNQELGCVANYVIGDIDADGQNDFAIELWGGVTLTEDDFIL
ncbi:calcium-binding protein [Sulfitobacter sabulilitoris]|uniref:Peptidase M10 serralysin C-terminal domain-containing protein n=1 Tax=Sulfitobacter sabulilitoris TaxID=2562655 RepID=A0A5S3P7Q5_9RHOB|nr:M10 family metallopeptidase C-terminal domain-containing protein [Sulfitobacter sabulilitoris]TMM49360.1 hypothetical protein FDT80_18125 [Sulfitobacter sabulilitoris]